MVPGRQRSQCADGLTIAATWRVGLAALMLGLTASGCLATKPVQREIVVQWSSESTDAQHDVVRVECGRLPGVVAEPRSPAGSAAGRQDDVRFDVTAASERQINALYGCLRGRPGVVGAAEPEQQ